MKSLACDGFVGEKEGLKAVTLTFVFITCAMHFYGQIHFLKSPHDTSSCAKQNMEGETGSKAAWSMSKKENQTHTYRGSTWGGRVVTVTNPCLHHPRYFPDSSCPWGCWRAPPSSWRETASLRSGESPYCCASSQNDRWVSPHDPRTRMGLSPDLDAQKTSGLNCHVPSFNHRLFQYWTLKEKKQHGYLIICSHDSFNRKSNLATI